MCTTSAGAELGVLPASAASSSSIALSPTATSSTSAGTAIILLLQAALMVGIAAISFPFVRNSALVIAVPFASGARLAADADAAATFAAVSAGAHGATAEGRDAEGRDAAAAAAPERAAVSRIGEPCGANAGVGTVPSRGACTLGARRTHRASEMSRTSSVCSTPVCGSYRALRDMYASRASSSAVSLSCRHCFVPGCKACTQMYRWCSNGQMWNAHAVASQPWPKYIRPQHPL